MNMRQIGLQDLDVTSGPITAQEPGLLRVADPIIRATVPGSSAISACVQFRYRGAVQDPRPSGSGRFLHQIGLMLRAANPCNLIYLTWRLLPEEEIVLQVKRNPDATMSNQCPGGSGYQRIAACGYPPFREGELHEVLATVSPRSDGSADTEVWIDWRKVLDVSIAPELLDGIAGPPGLRTDNGQFDFRYYVD
jgi:hypothetical protein